MLQSAALRRASTLVGLGVALVSCTRETEPREVLGAAQQQVFVNGDFEGSAANQPPSGWTITPYNNPGVTIQTPQTRAGLNLSAGGSAQTISLFSATGAESKPDPALGAGASLRWPKYGNYVSYLNTNGTNRNVNSLKQEMTLGVGDVDPADGKAHIRFAIAPVLENPNHSPESQPYYFVELTNKTRGITLYRDYNASAQPGVPWKISNGVYYTDWQLVDIAPTSAQAALGDLVELEVIAAGCSASGHYGRVYVDGVGAVVPGLFVSGTGPASANAGSDVIYTLAYKNGGTGDATNAVVQFSTPPNTVYQSVNAPGISCVEPAVNAAGKLTCTLGALAAGAGANFQVTVRIDAGANGVITAGNYDISATGISPLLGPKVFTTVTQNVVYADLAITKSNGVAGVAWGTPVTYTIVASNVGANPVNGATVTDTMPAQLLGVSWTCAGANGGTCAALGNGDIADATVGLPVGASVTYSVTGTLVAGNGAGTLANTASIAVPQGASDPDPSNNAAGDTDPIGSLFNVNLTKNGNGSVVSVPSAIACGLGCSSASGAFLQGSTVILAAIPAAGESFVGWSGACAGVGPCSFVLGGETAVTANFSNPLAADGVPCNAGNACLSGSCVDGVCCNTACGGGNASDCEACNIPGLLGTCTPVDAGALCRPSAGICDVAESCDGASPSCPVDTFVSSSTVCRASGGVCDLAESCTGTQAACPDDTFSPPSTVCRAPTGFCDKADSCTGTQAACPEDTFLPPSTVCRASTGFCDKADSCTGTQANCPADAYAAQGKTCRPSSGPCDLAEICTGASAACPADGFASKQQVCRPSAGICDAAESCTGLGPACPTDLFASSALICRHASGVCDVAESCTGSGAACPVDGFKTAATLCRASAGACDAAESCTGSAADCPSDAFALPSKVCRESAGACDLAESCTGADAACPPNALTPPSTVCRASAGVCDIAESCSGLSHNCPADAFAPQTQVCKAASCEQGTASLDAACTGASAACPAPVIEGCGAFQCGPSACLTACASGADCVAGNYCNAGVCSPQTPKGALCAVDAQCGTGYCVDGLCCGSACDGQCEACDLKNAPGVCTPVEGAPHGQRPACASDGSVCGGTCDGVNASACAFPTGEVTCHDASCTNLFATGGATCDGEGACPAPEVQSCAPFLCADVGCAGDCEADGQCQVGHFCNLGVCVDQRSLGAACSAKNQCVSGECVDGVCCNSACNGQCEACDVPAQLGTCSPVVGDPHQKRPACATDESQCGGACDGVNPTLCAYPDTSIVCRPGSCTAGVATLEATCNGVGSCPALQKQDCGEFVCGEKLCLADCALDADCQQDHYCSGGICTAKQAAGATCAGAGQCASDHCVDGVCCNTACNGQCEACDMAGKLGACLPILGAPHGARGTCNGIQGSACAGQCNGLDPMACAYPTAEIACRDAACVDGTATLAAFCNGEGACPDLTQQSCGEYACGGDECMGDCADEGQCSDGHFCAAGICSLKRVLGVGCNDNDECQDGHCVDGVCCSTACDGQCEACNLPDSHGVCTAITGQPKGGRAACPGQGTCAASCDGVNGLACVFPSATTVCAAPSCADDVGTLAATCNGLGTCQSAEQQTCGTFACGEAACATSCDSAAQCVPGASCVSGVCTFVEPHGGCHCTFQTGSTRGVVPLLAGLVALVLARRRRRR